MLVFIALLYLGLFYVLLFNVCFYCLVFIMHCTMALGALYLILSFCTSRKEGNE